MRSFPLGAASYMQTGLRSEELLTLEEMPDRCRQTPVGPVSWSRSRQLLVAVNTCVRFPVALCQDEPS